MKNEVTNDDELQMASIFMPRFARKRLRVKDNNTKFVHYTSAENAINIIRNKRIWMRNVKCMNDFMEIEHGFDMLLDYFDSNSETKNKFFESINSIIDGTADLAIQNFNEWFHVIRNNTFVCCVSEHDTDENKHGRLSMWRAYGKGTVGVAIVINNEPFYLNGEMGIVSSPVVYFSKKDLENYFDEIYDNIELNRSFLQKFTQDELIHYIFSTILALSVCVKHPGFHEEREWRVIFIDKMWPKTELLENSVESIGGIPQVIHKLILKENTNNGFIGIEPKYLIEKIIIGPSAYPIAIRDAFVRELEEVGVSDALSKIAISDIPLRT